MPTPSPKLGLALPSQTDDFETEDLRQNWETLDASPGTFICTSGTKPTGWTSAQAGRHIYEKDTGTTRVWDGTEWVVHGNEPGDLKVSHRAAPSKGWLLCDGRSVPRTTYPALFAAIGTSSGNVDAASFNLPDYRNRSIRGSGPGTARGQLVGNDSVILGTSNLPAHTHTMVHNHTASASQTNTDHLHHVTLGGGGHEHLFTRDFDLNNRAGGGLGTSDNSHFQEWTQGGGAHSHSGYTDGSDRASGAVHSHFVNVDMHNGSTGSVGGNAAFSIVPASTVSNVFVKA